MTNWQPEERRELACHKSAQCHAQTITRIRALGAGHQPQAVRASLSVGFKADVVVAEQLILEIKSVATILAVHEMQLRTYLRMSNIRVGLLLNFNAPRLMDGLRRYVV